MLVYNLKLKREPYNQYLTFEIKLKPLYILVTMGFKNWKILSILSVEKSGKYDTIPINFRQDLLNDC